MAAISLPDNILQHHKNVTLCIDIIYVNKMIFFHSISRKLKIRTVSNIINRDKNTLLKETRNIIDLYKNRGFEEDNIHADMELECICTDMLPIHCDITPNDAHVPEVERSIRTIKEHVRADINDFPFKRFPRIVIVELVRRAVKCLNQFPALDGVSDTVSPFTMLTGKPIPDYSKITLDFGTYVQVFEDNNPTNATMPRSTGAIALNPTGNVTGDFYFMSLKTGRRLSRRKWKVIPITSEVITTVEQLAHRDGQVHVSEGCPIFEWNPNNIIDDETEDDNIVDDVFHPETNINVYVTDNNIDVNDNLNDSEDDEDPDYESDSDSDSDDSSID
jgi:hypothetical protein